MSADHQSLRTSIAHLWARRAEHVRAETEGQLATELRALEKRGLFPNPSSQAGDAAARVARREGESILRATLVEALQIDSIAREGLGNDELVRDLESALQTCIEDWARRRVPRLLRLANFRSVTNDIEREVVFHLKTALGRDIRAEVAKLWLGRHAQQDSSASSMGADRRAVVAGAAQALDTAKSGSRGPGQEGPAAGSLPPVSDDGTEMKGRLDKLPAAEAKMPEAGSGGASWPAITLFSTVFLGCLFKGLDYRGEGRGRTGSALLALAWIVLAFGLFRVPHIRARWRYCGLPITLSLVAGCVILVLGVLAGEPRDVPPGPSGGPGQTHVTDVSAAPDVVGTKSFTNIPEAQPVEPEPEARVREAKQPPPPAPAIGAGATVTQQSSGDNSPNVVASGDVTINPPVDPNAPSVYYFPNGKTRTQVGSTVTLGDGRMAAYQRMLSLNESGSWEKLAGLCEDEIKATPDWLTPYLFAGVAHANLGELATARNRLEEFERRARGNPAYANLHAQSLTALASVTQREAGPASSGGSIP